MKYNKLFTGLLCAAAVAFTGCADDDTVASMRGTGWDAAAGYADIYFPVAGTDGTVELNPTDPTQMVVKVARRDSIGEKTVQFYAQENTDDVFEFGTATFPDTEWETDLIINFPKAEVGKTYNLVLTSNDPNAVTQYTQDIVYKASIQRVKWNPAGFYYAADGSKVEGYALYGDDVFSCWFGIDPDYLFPVKVEERDDKPGYYRVENPYGEAYPWNDPGDWDDTQLRYLYIDATDPDKVYFPERLYTTTDWGYGEFVVWSVAGYYLARNDASSAEDYYGTYANGEIRFPEDALLVAMLNYANGGLYMANNNGKWRLILDPDQVVPEEEPPYEANIETDFDFEPVFTGLFTSAFRRSSWDNVLLEVGVDTVTTDDADKRFAQEVGTLYRINSPYTDGYDITFIINPDGDVVVPEGYEMQPIGITAANGDDLYAKINAKGNSFNGTELILSINVQNAKGTLVYPGPYIESLANITWTQVGTGDYLYNFFADDEPEWDEGYIIEQRDDRPNTYRIEDWTIGSTLVWTWDKATNTVTVPGPATGYVHPSYGMIYACDAATFDYRYDPEEYPTYFDPETNIFHLGLVYYVEAGSFGAFNEAIKATFDENGEVKSLVRAARTLPKFYIVDNTYSRVRITPTRRAPQRHVMKTFVNDKTALTF